jgi:hypothetical protein
MFLTREEDFAAWTCEMFRLMRRAHVFDVGECEAENSYLNKA